MSAAEEPWAALEAGLAKAERFLLTPSAEACEAAATELEALDCALRALPSALSAPSLPPDADRARRLRAGLRRISLLFDNAAAFRLGWARLLGALAAGYTSRGEPASLDPPARIALEG